MKTQKKNVTNVTVKKKRETTKEKLLKALKQTKGVIAPACELVGIERITYYRYIDDDKAFAQAVEDIKEGQIDFVESKLVEKINEGDTSSIIFYLKTRGRDRGYSERLELTGKDGKNLLASKSDEELEERIKELESKINI